MQVRTELALLRTDVQGGRSVLHSKNTSTDDRLESMHGDLTLLAQETSKGSSAQHLLQLEVAQLRTQLEEAERERRRAEHEAASQRAAWQERLDAAGQDARSSLQALDSDVCTLRTHAERQLSAHAAAIEQLERRADVRGWRTRVRIQRVRNAAIGAGILTNPVFCPPCCRPASEACLCPSPVDAHGAVGRSAAYPSKDRTQAVSLATRRRWSPRNGGRRRRPLLQRGGGD